MRTIKILFFLLPALLQLTDAGAVVTGDLINRDGITYVVTLKRDAGNGHPAAYHVAFVGSDLAEVKIPETVKDSANEHTWTVTALADNSKVKNATSVTIPNTVETLNAQCLQGSLLTTVNIPASATDIKDGVFAFTLGLQRITVDAANPRYYARDGVLYSRDGGGYLVAYPVARAGAAYSIPEGIVGIRPNALQQNRNLETIRLPKSLTDLPAAKEYNGFTSALKLSAIEVDPANPKFSGVGGVILSKDGEQLVVYPNAKKGDPYTVPATVRQILDGAFGHAEGLKGIVMTPPLVKIGKESFKDCIQLLTVTIPSTVTKIDDGAFSGAYRVEGFVVDPSNTVYKTDDEGVIYSADGTELAAFPAGMTGTYATLPTTKRILKEAFKAAPAVEKVIFNSGLETIGQDAFQAATGLKRIEFAAPATVRAIGDFSFYGSALETLGLPASVETVGWSAFANCPRLKTVSVEAHSRLQKTGTSSFENCGSLESFVFEGACALKTVGNRTFMNDPKLTGFRFPSKVEEIETGAFNGCKALVSVTFPADAVIRKIGKGAFQNALSLPSITLPASVESIEESAFNSCQSLVEIKIPATTTSIDPRAFQFCGKLATFTVDPSNPSYSSVDGFLLSKDKKTLATFPPAKAGTYYTLLPPVIEKIGDYAFYYVQNLENITIPEGVTEIGNYAFDNCSRLNTIAFLSHTPVPASKIGDKAFNEDNVNKGGIEISVRVDAFEAYKNNPFWNAFHDVIRSFKVDDGDGATELFPLSKSAVMVVDVQSDVFTYVVPKKVKHPQYPARTYEVRLWNDRAMAKSNTDIKEVVFKGQLDYLGIEAFQRQDGTSTVERVFFTGNPPKDMSAVKWYLGAGYREFTGNIQKIYVKKSKVDAYKTAVGWDGYAARVDYQIRDVNITHKYGSFAREFDTDFGEYAREKGTQDKVAAFVATRYGEASVSPGKPDYGTATHVVFMSSVDVNGGVVGDPCYVPAEEGVLLKVLGSESMPSDFFYTIGEKDDKEYTVAGSIMRGVTAKARKVPASGTFYAVSASKGVFMKLKPSATVPVHRAYAELPGIPAAAKVMFAFEGEGSATGILSVGSPETREDGGRACYNLNGQRVEKPQRGVYIRGGKKYVVR